MGKTVINLEKMLRDLAEIDGFFRGYFKIKIHDYHYTIENCKSLVEREKQEWNDFVHHVIVLKFLKIKFVLNAISTMRKENEKAINR